MIYYNDINTGNTYLDEALENYLMHGFEPGGFLNSVLANDLRLALGRADYWNKQNIDLIVDAVARDVPAIAQGSYQHIKDWCEDKDGRRSAHVAHKEKEFTWKALKGDIREKITQDPLF
jgi:hypothetical protein